MQGQRHLHQPFVPGDRGESFFYSFHHPFSSVIDGAELFAVCVQRLTKCSDRIGNQSSPQRWLCACLPSDRAGGAQQRGRKQLLSFSPRSCFGFYFYFSQDRVAGEGSQGSQRKERRQRASIGMQGEKELCRRGGEREAGEGQLMEVLGTRLFFCFSLVSTSHPVSFPAPPPLSSEVLPARYEA